MRVQACMRACVTLCHVCQTKLCVRAEYFRKILRLNEQYPFMVSAAHAALLLMAIYFSLMLMQCFISKTVKGACI